MKVLKLIVAGIMILLTGATYAQVSVSVSFGSPPPWGPVGHSGVQYYYLPDVEAYYDVRSAMFIYFGDGAWVRRSSLPPRYRNYDLYRGYKVTMPGYHGNTPYSHFKEHKSRYGKGYRGKPQQTIHARPGSGNPGSRNPHDDHPGNRRGGHDDQGDNHNKGKKGGHDHDRGGGNGKKK